MVGRAQQEMYAERPETGGLVPPQALDLQLTPVGRDSARGGFIQSRRRNAGFSISRCPKILHLPRFHSVSCSADISRQEDRRPAANPVVKQRDFAAEWC